MSAAPRFVPMVGDAMVPTVKPGDLVAVLSGAAWRGDGLYVICEASSPVVIRASSDFRGGVCLSYDNERYTAWTMTRDEFTAALLGNVFAICNVTDPGVMREAGILAGWDAGHAWLLGSAGA